MKHLTKIAALCTALIPATALAQTDIKKTTFELKPNAAFIQCLAADGVTAPVAKVIVRRGDLNDTLEIHVTGLKPNLQFDLFTVRHSPLLSNGPDGKNPAFTGTFGLAWYQSDLDSDEDGVADLVMSKKSGPLRSIFLDQIFGFDGDKNADGSMILPPTNTLHLGFWFNNPQDAAPCGFDVTHPTPFNGDHKAGPLAMISDEGFGENHPDLGPLCVTGISECNGQ